jgi:hypothetical protein
LTPLSLVALLCGTAAAAPVEFEDARIERIGIEQAQVAKLRRLPSLRAVEVAIESPAQMRARMEQELDEDLRPGELEDLAFTWALLGLAPPDLPLRSLLLSVLEDAVGGYYAPKDRRLVIVDRPLAGAGAAEALTLERMVVAHELVHALQDQHFDLQRLTERDMEDGDALLAIQALVEGDASYAMLYRVMPDPDLIPPQQLAVVVGLGRGAQAGEPGTPIGDAPRALLDPLVFPYTDGLLFAQRVKLTGKDWSAIDAAYARPPLSTEQILHPERYLGESPDWPTRALLDRPETWLGDGWRVAGSETMGELGVALLLSESAPGVAAEAAAAGWDGDRLVVWRDGTRGAAAWVSTWDTEADAVEFAEAATALARALRPAARWRTDGAGTTGREKDRHHRIARDGVRVTWLLDVPSRAVEAVIDGLGRTTWAEADSLDDYAPPPEVSP